VSTTLDEPALAKRPYKWAAFAYVLMLVAAIGAFALIRHAGESLIAPGIPPGVARLAKPAAAGTVHVLPHVLATLAAVIALGFVLGRAFRFLGQPPVIGEVIAGILLGPSLLGAFYPEAMHALIPSRETDPNGLVRSAIQAIAQLGVILYMFLVGLELNGAKLKHQAHATIAVSHASIVVPFVLGAALALVLYPILSHRGVPFTSFALFLGAALSVTAFPVLARILADRALEKSELGIVALGCAAADDVTAWCLLAFVVGVAQAQVDDAVLVPLAALAFILVVYFVVRPLMKRLTAVNFLHPAAIPLTFIAVLLAALTTEAIGVHAVFGAFLFGAVIPHDSLLAREFIRKLKDVVTVLLLPAFFALAGLQTDIRLLGSWENVLICAVIIVVATLGKFGGTFVAARLAGRDNRSAAALGAMMNTRGLMGLIVLDIGLSLGVITPTLFAMMVLMALATTLATAPALMRLHLPATDHAA
jgi:Kef-type K+ transport system membrane component KefB